MIKDNLLRDINVSIGFAAQDGCDPPSKFAQNACLFIGHDFISKIKDCTYALFGEDNGGIDLIVDSKSLRRRVTLRFNNDGHLVSLISIDEFLNLRKASAENFNLDKYIKWMNNQ